MNKQFLAVLAAPAVALLIHGQALARHVTHPVTPANIDKQPFGTRQPTTTIAVLGLGALIARSRRLVACFGPPLQEV